MRALSFLGITSVLLLPSLVAAQTTNTEDIYEGGPEAPIVLSVDYPDENSWQRPVDAAFSWPLPNEVTAVAAEVTFSPDTEPMKAYRPPITEISVSATAWREGIQYVTVQFKNDEKWGQFTSRRVMIDGTAPEPFDAEITPYEGDVRGVTIKAEATDVLSGLSHFEVSLDGQTPERVEKEEMRSGYMMPINDDDTHNLKVSAVDKAGNMRVFSAPLLSIPPKAISAAKDPFGYAASEPASILVSFMAGVMLLTFGYLVYERQRYAAAITSLREEADDVHGQMLRVFGALREEIYDQVNSINKKPRLTKKEKEAVEGLNKALVVSEKLLDKEVKDIKKLLK